METTMLISAIICIKLLLIAAFCMAGALLKYTWLVNVRLLNFIYSQCSEVTAPAAGICIGKLKAQFDPPANCECWF